MGISLAFAVRYRFVHYALLFLRTSLFFLQADNYRSEVEELRSNLSSSLESYSKMGR